MGIDLLGGLVVDICGSRNDMIVARLEAKGGRCRANDCNPFVKEVDTRLDASDPAFVGKLRDEIGRLSSTTSVTSSSTSTSLSASSAEEATATIVRAVVTSPPYSQMIPILRIALQLATHYVIMKLPLSLMIVGPLQEERRNFWRQYPQHCLIPVPRGSRSNGHKLNFDEAWFVWALGSAPKPTNAFVYAL